MQAYQSIDLADARTIADAARRKAVSEGWDVVIAVLDVGGHLILLECADNALRGSIPIAQAKAQTALLFRRSTKMLEEAINAGHASLLSLAGATTIEGGLPVVVDGQIVGSIGVSGVQSFEDGIVAQAGVDALGR